MKRALAVTGLLGVVLVPNAHAQRQDAVFFRDAWNVKSYPAAPRLAENAAMVPAVSLPAASTSMPEVIDAIQQWNAGGREPMRNGFKRTLPDAIDLRLPGSVAAKTGTANYARGVVATSDRATIWSTVIEVANAHRLRLHLENVKLPDSAVLWVHGAGEQPIGFGRGLVDATGSLWTPSVSGSLAYLEIEVPAGSEVAFVLHEVMELVAPQYLGKPKSNDAPTCLIDATCVAASLFAKIASAEAAVAHLEFVVPDGNAVCTGGLLTDRGHSGTPYLLTANHCISDQTTATSLEAYFDYRTATCNGTPPAGSSVPRVNGAQLLATMTKSDFAFLQLSSRPSGRVLLGWDARSSSIGSGGVHLNRVSHPVPDGTIRPQQYSSTQIDIGVDICNGTNGPAIRPRFIYSTGGQGGVYGGSSGSPVMLDDGSVVGQLLGSCPSNGSNAHDGCDPRNSTVDGAFATTYDSITTWIEGGGPVTPTVCTPSATTLCLSGNRFAASAVWKKPDNSTGQAQAVALTSDTGYFWWESANNVEMVLKVLNACSFASRVWVFAGGLTNIQVTMTVVDTQTGTVKTYINPQGTAFQPIQDVNAFSTCP